MGWFPYAVKFQRKHGCRLTCAMSALFAPLFRRAYLEIEFVTHEEVVPERHYATYNVGLFFVDTNHDRPPIGPERMLRIHIFAHWFNLADLQSSAADSARERKSKRFLDVRPQGWGGRDCQVADSLYQWAAPSHGTVKFISRIDSPWRSMSIKNIYSVKLKTGDRS